MLNPSSATAHYFAGHINAFAGNSAAATMHAERALRLSPFDVLAWEAPYALSIVAVHEGRYAEAASWSAKSVQANPASPSMIIAHACGLALAGRIDEGKAAAKQALQISPGLRARFMSEIGMAPSIAAKFAAGARLLGLPE